MERIERVIEEMKNRQLSQLVVSDPDSIAYLTGVKVHPGERFYVLLIRNNGWHVLFANHMFEVPAIPYEVIRYGDSDDPVGLLSQQIDPSRTLGIDKQWPAQFLIPLIARTPGLKVGLGSDCVDEVRAVKDEQEIAWMKDASRINDLVMERVRTMVTGGVTEKQLAQFIEQEYMKMGCEGTSFPPIVSFGANAADPHHGPDDTVIKEGDVVLFDIGCRKNGYCSDMTRSYFYRTVTEKQIMIHELVRLANEHAESIIKPGVRFCDIDAAARNIITEAGYGQYFTHRLGHFIGTVCHEKGDVSAANEAVAEPGMIFSIEPGVYLPGEFGVRIEDLVLVTENGCEVLNHASKKYEVLI